MSEIEIIASASIELDGVSLSRDEIRSSLSHLEGVIVDEEKAVFSGLYARVEITRNWRAINSKVRSILEILNSNREAFGIESIDIGFNIASPDLYAWRFEAADIAVFAASRAPVFLSILDTSKNSE